MELVTTLHSRRLEKIHEGEVHPALAPVLRDARHARDPADDPAQERSRPPQGPGAGLADTYPDERAYGAPAPTTEARLWPCGSRRGSADPAGGEARGDQLRLVHQDKSLPRDQGGAAAELLRVGGGASVREAGPQGAEARAGCAGAASASPGRSRSGPHGWLAARIT